MNYLQKKKQAIIMILAAQIIKTAEGYPVTINDCKSGAAVDYTVLGNTVTGKNLISYPYIDTTKTVNGITFTDNGDGSITVNGTATANAIFYLFRNNKSLINSLNIGDTFTASVTSDKTWNQSATMYLICNYYDSSGGMNSGLFVQNPDKGKTITISDSWGGMEIYLVVYKGKTIDNVTVKPMIEKGETATEYEPYTEKYVGDKTLVSDNTYKYKIPIVNSGKNSIPYPYYQTTKTTNGITFTDNGDGSITVNGTATNKIFYHLVPPEGTNALKLPAAKYYFSDDCNSSSSPRRFLIQAKKRVNSGWTNLLSMESGNGVFDITKLECDCIWVVLAISAGDTFGNVTFKPQLELGETATEYEPYRAPVTASIYLDEPLKKDESVNFGADRLPELQLFEGSNIVTADTAVNPQKISVDYYEKE